MKYKCEICGKEHENYPALAYNSPDNYYWLTDEEKIVYNAKLDTDFCTIEYPDQTDRFIRVVLIQEITNHCDNLEYGLWVTLSEESFNDYYENYENENHEKQYFGWLSSSIPPYNFEQSIPTTVVTKKGNQRPQIFPHKDFDDPFVKDFYDGISKEEAERRIREMYSNLK